MSIRCYFLDLLRVYEGGNDSFLMSLVVCLHAILLKKRLIKNRFTLEGYNAKGFPATVYGGPVLLEKLQVTGSVDSRPVSGTR